MVKRIGLSVMVSVLLLMSFVSTSTRVPRVLPTPMLMSSTQSVVRMVTVKEPVYVYLCEGPASKVYHASPDCRGLSRCSTKIYKVTMEEAVKMGRRPCNVPQSVEVIAVEAIRL